jgi:hypothetical protein
MEDVALPGEDHPSHIAKKPKVIHYVPTMHYSVLTIHQIQDSPKTIWLITYASGSPDITTEILAECNLQCNECYTTTWRESKYTLINLGYPNRKRATGLERAMAKMLSDHGIKGNAIHGYDMLSSNSKSENNIMEHPGFKRIVQQLNEKKDELRIWMKEEGVMTNKSGILWNFLDIRDPQTMSKAQLIERVHQLSDIKTQHTTLKDAFGAIQAAFTAQGRELAKEKTQSHQFFIQLCEQIEECKHLKIELSSR